MKNERVAIVLLNWNTAKDTIECIESLRNLTYQNFQIVVVDNCSQVSDYKDLTSAAGVKAIFRQRRNLGFAGGCNVGIRWALRNRFDYIWLLNSDTIVEPASLDELIDAMQTDSKIGIAGAVVYYWSDPKRIQTAGGIIDPETCSSEMLREGEVDNGQFCGLTDVAFVSGAALLVRTDAIKKVGLLDERFFMYYEDTDWGARMRKHGWRVVSVSSAKVWHKDRGSAGEKRPYFLQHGYFVFLYKNFPHHLPHALRLYARHYLRPHLERRQWRLAWEDAKVYLSLLSRLAFGRANLQP